MPTNRKNTKLEFVSICQTLATGVLALPDATLLLSEHSVTRADATAPLLAYVTAAAQAAAAKAAYTKALQVQKDAEAAAHASYDLLKPFLQGRFGKSNPVLETTYGIPPAKTPQKTVAAKAAAIAKSATTRAANHTMGPKQKKAAKEAPVQPAPIAGVPAPTAAPGTSKPQGA